MIHSTSIVLLQDERQKELHRALRVGLLCGKCIELHSTTNELNHHSSLSIPHDTTIAVVSLQSDQRQHFQRIVDRVSKRAKSNCEGQLRIFYVCRRSDNSDAHNEEHEAEKIQQALKMLPQGISYAIPSTDIKRLSLIGRSSFYDPHVFSKGTGPKLCCFTVDVREDNEGHQALKDVQYVRDDESEESLPENSDEENDISDGILQFLCGSKTHSFSEQSCRLPGKNMVGEFIQKLKNDNIYHFGDNKVNL